MKKFLALVLLVGLAAGGGYVWFLQSVHFVLFEMKKGVDTPDVALIEKSCDLDRVATGFIDFGQAVVEVSAEDTAGTFGRALIQDLAALYRAVGEDRTKASIKDELRATVAEGRVYEVLGPFKPGSGFEAIGGIEEPAADVKRVLILGTCEDGPAELAFDFERASGGPYGLPTYKCVGMSKESARKLAKVCHAHAKTKAEGKR